MNEMLNGAPFFALTIGILAGFRRILLYAVLPPLTWAAAALVEILLDQLI
jgi:hypothetical protein